MDVLRLRDGEVDLRDGVVRRAAVQHRLTTRELDLLRYLAPRTHRAVSREELMREVWAYSDSARSRAVDFTVHRLRSKLESDPSEPRHLLTVYSVGFRLAPGADDEPGPPSGWVTLLGVVAGSADAASGLAVSERLVAAVQAHGGHPARGDGERWLAAFATSESALACAGQVRADACGSSLGFGLATGVAHPVREPMTGLSDYRDPSAARALALAAVAPPGGVLLDAASADGMPPERDVQPIGAYAIPGEALDLWSWPGALEPRAAAIGQSNVARDLDGFVGRVDALVTLREARTPVAVTGPGGIGKSRLVRELARAEIAAGNETWWCCVATARTAAEVVAAVREALGLSGVADVGQALAWRDPVLLVIDEAEGCMASVEAQIAVWRGAAPNARFVLTSRVRPSGPGWRILPVGPLPPDEGTTLLVERARRVRPGFATDRTERERATDLVQALGGWPLAIEIVAGQTAVHTVDELLARIPAGEDTLEASIARSLDALGERQLRGLVRLSVPPGGFDLGLAEALLGPDAPELLAALVSASLVNERVEAASLRFSVPPPVASSVARRGPAAERRAAEADMARCLLDRFGPEPEPPPTASQAAALRRETENLLAVVHAAADAETRARAVLALSVPWRAVAPPEALRALLDEALADPPPTAERRAQLRLIRGHVRLLVGDAAGADEDFAAVPADGGRLEARALLGLGNVARVSGDLETAEHSYRRALQIRVALGHDGAQGVLLGALAAVAGERGDVDGSEALLEQALDRLRAVEWRAMEAPTWSMLAVARIHQRRWDEALRAARRALQGYREHGDRPGEAMSLLRLDQIRRFGGMPLGREGELAIAVARAIGDRRVVAGVQSFRGATAIADGRHDEAEALLSEAMALDPDRTSLAYCESLRAESDLERGRLAEARQHLEAAAALTPPGHRLTAYRWCLEAVAERDPALARRGREQLANEADGVAFASHAEALAGLLRDPDDPEAIAAARALLAEEPPSDLAVKSASFRRMLQQALRALDLTPRASASPAHTGRPRAR